MGVSAVTVWALVSNRPRLGQTLLGVTVLLALPAVAIWVAVLAFIALAIQVRTARPRRSGWSALRRGRRGAQLACWNSW